MQKMYRQMFRIVSIATFAGAVLFFLPAASSPAAGTKIGIVNFKRCIEGSKLGKQEQARFEQIKKQLEASIDAKEKELNDLSPKFSAEYLDTLSPEAERELQNKYKTLNQEHAEMQNKYYTMLNQANYQIVQQMSDAISKAAKKIALGKGLDVALNEEVCFYHGDSLDISNEVIGEMDAQFQKDAPKPEKG